MLPKYIGICFLMYNFSLFAADRNSNGSGLTSSGGSLVRKDPSPVEMTSVVSAPDSPQHTILNLGEVGRNQSTTSIASQLTARHREALEQSTPPDLSARLAQEFAREIQLRTVAPLAVSATPLAGSSGSSPHSSSEDDEHTSTSDAYSHKLEQIIKNQEIQLVAQTKMTVFYQVGREEERERNRSQSKHVFAGYVLTAVGLIGMIGFGIVPFTSGCG